MNWYKIATARKVTQEIEDQIVEQYTSGISTSLDTIARQFGIARGTVAAALKRRGIPLRDVLGYMSQNKVVELYRSGKNFIEISKTLHIAPMSIYITLKNKNLLRNNLPGDKAIALNRIPIKIENQVINLYLSGKSARQVAQATGINATSVTNILKRRNIPQREFFISEETANRVVEAYQSGKTLYAIYKELGIDPGTTQRILKNKNIPLRPSKPTTKYTPQLVDMMAKDYLSWMSSRDISKKYNVSERTILRWLKKKGIPIRDLSESITNAFKQKPEIIENLRKRRKEQWQDPNYRNHILQLKRDPKARENMSI